MRLVDGFSSATLPKPQPTTSSLNPRTSTFNPCPSTRTPQTSILHPQPSTLDPQCSAFNPEPQPPILNSDPSSLKPEPPTLNHQSSTPNPPQAAPCRGIWSLLNLATPHPSPWSQTLSAESCPLNATPSTQSPEL